MPDRKCGSVNEISICQRIATSHPHVHAKISLFSFPASLFSLNFSCVLRTADTPQSLGARALLVSCFLLWVQQPPKSRGCPGSFPSPDFYCNRLQKPACVTRARMLNKATKAPKCPKALCQKGHRSWRTVSLLIRRRHQRLRATHHPQAPSGMLIRMRPTTRIHPP
jgi:hypothetical protein